MKTKRYVQISTLKAAYNQSTSNKHQQMENHSVANTLYLNCLKVISTMQLPIRVAAD